MEGPYRYLVSPQTDPKSFTNPAKRPIVSALRHAQTGNFADTLQRHRRMAMMLLRKGNYRIG